jgi:hypothetical protein
MGYIRANGAIGISLRENGRHIAHSVRTLLVSAPVPEGEKNIADATPASPRPSLDSDPTLPTRTTWALSFLPPRAFVVHDRPANPHSRANLS